MVRKALGIRQDPSSSTYTLPLRFLCSVSEGLYKTAHGMPYANLEIRPLTKQSMWYEIAPTATARLLQEIVSGFDKESGHPYVFISGLKNFNPRSESRSLSSWVSHGLEANPPTRKADYVQIFRCENQEVSYLPTEGTERIPVKFSLMELTVAWMEGSKNPATSFLRTGRGVNGNTR